MPGSAIVDLSTSYGAALIGFIVSTALFGLTLGQTWVYFWHYWNKDTNALKSYVAFLTVMDTAHTIMVAYTMYWYLVLNFGNLEALSANKWFFIIQGNFGGIYSSSVQLYYARQIYLVSRSVIPPILIVSFTIIGNSLGFYDTAKQLAGTEVATRFKPSSPWIIGIPIGMVGAQDIMIAGLMCWALYRKKTGIASTDSMIMTLMAYTINSGLLTSLIGLSMTIAYIRSRESLISMAIFFTMGKFYVNSVLAMLNSRDYVRDRSGPDNSDNSVNLTSFQIAPPSDALESKSRQTDGSIMVQRSTASNYALDKSDDIVGHTFEVSKLETAIASQSQRRISESSV